MSFNYATYACVKFEVMKCHSPSSSDLNGANIAFFHRDVNRGSNLQTHTSAGKPMGDVSTCFCCQSSSRRRWFGVLGDGDDDG